VPNEKQYSKVELDDVTMEQWERESDPRYLVERVTRCEHTRLGGSATEDMVNSQGRSYPTRHGRIDTINV
jgi:hypothetical protein